MKTKTIVVLLLCVLTAVLAACSTADKAGGSAAPTAMQTQSPSPSASASPAEGSASLSPAPATTAVSETDTDAGAIDLGRVTFPPEFDEYFGGDAKTTIKRLEPILLAAAQAAYASSDVMAGTPDAAGQWAVMYQYLNTYGDADFDKQEDGTLEVGKDSMLSLFRSLFGAAADELPALQTAYDIRYDDSREQYLIGRSDFGDVTFALTDLALSDTYAFITLSAEDGSATQFDVMIAVEPGADSRFGYSIFQITQMCGDT